MARKISTSGPAAKSAKPALNVAASPPEHETVSREEKLLRLVAGLLADSDLTEIEIEKGDLRVARARRDRGGRPRPSRRPIIKRRPRR